MICDGMVTACAPEWGRGVVPPRGGLFNGPNEEGREMFVEIETPLGVLPSEFFEYFLLEVADDR